MIICNEFIWKTDQYGYHITSVESMKGICTKGLIPSLGERSKSVGETEKGIFFIYNLYEMHEWINTLYKERNIQELELLRFNLKNRKWHMRVGYSINDLQEFYLVNKVLPERIQYARVFNSNNEELTLDTNDKNINITWNNLKDYKPLVKKMV
jgi:hypothetical protein